jgi:hypothetical protein
VEVKLEPTPLLQQSWMVSEDVSIKARVEVPGGRWALSVSSMAFSKTFRTSLPGGATFMASFKSDNACSVCLFKKNQKYFELEFE